jgi:hypothetical protein
MATIETAMEDANPKPHQSTGKLPIESVGFRG